MCTLISLYYCGDDILSCKTLGIWWSCLLEVAAAITNEADNVKRQWLLDALEMSCMSEYPSTVSISHVRQISALQWTFSANSLRPYWQLITNPIT